VGDAQFGRGYDPAQLTGDYMVAAKAELHYEGTRAPFILGIEYLAGEAGLRYLQFYQFFDFGAVWDRSPRLRGEAGGNRSLTSAGAGLRAGIGSRFTASAEVGKPLTRGIAAFADRDDAKSLRYTFSVGVF